MRDEMNMARNLIRVAWKTAAAIIIIVVVKNLEFFEKTWRQHLIEIALKKWKSLKKYEKL